MPFGPVGLCPIFRPFRLGLGVLFSKKPEPDLRARAQARPTSSGDALAHDAKSCPEQCTLPITFEIYPTENAK
jgi:hypothetical protein